MQTFDVDGFASPEELRDEFMARLLDVMLAARGGA